MSGYDHSLIMPLNMMTFEQFLSLPVAMFDARYLVDHLDHVMVVTKKSMYQLHTVMEYRLFIKRYANKTNAKKFCKVYVYFKPAKNFIIYDWRAHLDLQDSDLTDRELAKRFDSRKPYIILADYNNNRGDHTHLTQLHGTLGKLLGREKQGSIVDVYQDISSKLPSVK